jgi:16S rRNA (cytosine1402-N4)-methyltransferase
MKTKGEHVPVLLKEVVKNLDPKESQKFVDATFGFGGHTKAICKSGGQVLAIERDPKTIILAKKHHTCPDASCQLVEGNFAKIKEIAEEYDFVPVKGVLFDLGVSLWHYLKAKRGFSFNDSNLDMRLNPKQEIKALDIVNDYSLNELDELFTKLVQEKLAKQIAEAVVRARRLKPIKSAQRLAQLVKEVYQKKREKTKSHPATKVFLALRIVVNQELENLKKGLNGAWQILEKNGKLLVISFHSTEDRIAKKFGRNLKKENRAEIDLIKPTEKEIKKNPLARSALLRVIIKKQDD